MSAISRLLRPAPRLLHRPAAHILPARRLASSSPSPIPAAATSAAAGYAPSYSPTGLWSSIKNAVGAAAHELPPNYTPDPATLTESPTRVTTLPSGLRVASENSHPGVGAATIGLWIDAGTRYEGDDVNGAAHFLEHLIFKGTGKRSQRQLEVEVENMGAHLNAYTSREQTVYYARARAGDVEKVAELLGDIVTNSEVTEGSVERERGVILRESQEIDGMVEEVLFDHLHETAFQGTPLAKTILGPEENIRKLKKADLKGYIKTHYHPNRMVLVGAGDLEHDKLVELAEKHFSGLGKSSSADADEKETSGSNMATMDLVKANPAFLVGSEVRVRNDDMKEAHVAIAWESCGWAHPDAVSFSVFQALLGSYDRTARTTASLSSAPMTSAMAAIPNVKSVTPFNASYTDTGLFGIYVIAEPPALDDVAYAAMGEVVRPCFKVDDEQLERAKAALKTQTLAAMDGSTGVAEEIGRQMLAYGRKVPVAELFARIDAVDSEALKRIAGKYIYDREIAVAAMGPVHSLPDYSWLRKHNYWLAY